MTKAAVLTTPRPSRSRTNGTQETPLTVAENDGKRVAEALRTQETFTRDQATWLFQLGLRWGYEARVDEENSDYPPPMVFTLGRWYDQAEERAKANAAARLHRPGDFCGRGAPPMRAAA
jgi:hypothetical protein